MFGIVCIITDQFLDTAALDQEARKSSLTYTERLTLLGLELLEAWRIRADLLFVYKLLFGFAVLRADHYFCLSERSVTNCFYLAAPPTFVNMNSAIVL